MFVMSVCSWSTCEVRVWVRMGRSPTPRSKACQASKRFTEYHVWVLRTDPKAVINFDFSFFEAPRRRVPLKDSSLFSTVRGKNSAACFSNLFEQTFELGGRDVTGKDHKCLLYPKSNIYREFVREKTSREGKSFESSKTSEFYLKN